VAVHEDSMGGDVLIGGTFTIEKDEGKYSVAIAVVARGCGSICSLAIVDPRALYLPMPPKWGGSLYRGDLVGRGLSSGDDAIPEGGNV